jgi:hypothetical protein
MPSWEVRAARGGEPAGAPTPRDGDSPVATPSQPPCRPVRRLRYGLPVCFRPGRRARDRCRAGLPPPLSRILHGSAPSGAQRQPPRSAGQARAALAVTRGELCVALTATGL